ncbi:antibiotic biosynthesis monooxygenase [Clostridium sp. YIM B02505]|uniref:Antibiotic biosynthesis monooxygenase n=1 Tax=Clostridium yunnanense TaxID=2800325 RepID=A0ABS1EWJ8_9CLOT|nr:putative quinol monooxygenase [Clostridium yunnanense]MBK1813756.1 antibiotic biosynthesis monooxygenase [Clostridium yunnanense]
MIKVVAKHYVVSDKIEELLELSKELVAATVKEEGCISYGMYQDIKDNTILTMIEEWESSEALKKHMESEHFKAIVPKMAGFMEKPAELNIYSKVI